MRAVRSAKELSNYSSILRRDEPERASCVRCALPCLLNDISISYWSPDRAASVTGARLDTCNGTLLMVIHPCILLTDLPRIMTGGRLKSIKCFGILSPPIKRLRHCGLVEVFASL
jgi:hypothetical protein